MANEFFHFENEETLVKELLENLNSQYEYIDDKENQGVYYDWIYWVLGKLTEIKDKENGIVNI